jgi:alpha-glucosidase (family GH31 glycosyl hydrolase)
MLVSQAAGATLLSHQRRGNVIELRLSEGAAEIEWLSSSSFRLRRALAGVLPQAARAGYEAVALEVADGPGELVFTTRHVQLRVRKPGVLLKVTKLDGTPLMQDLTEARVREGAIAWERAAEWGVQVYGLGPRVEAHLNVRGRREAHAVPFLVTTAGYGEYHAAPGRYTFDLTRADRYGIDAAGASLIDYYFYFGPTPKEIYEEHLLTGAVVAPPPEAAPAAGSWNTLRDSLLRLAHGSFSGILRAEFDLAPYQNAPTELRERAGQLAGVINRGYRKDLVPLFVAYEQERRDRGLPLIRPLAFQFPGDPQAARHPDEFMLGDELLIAPITVPGYERTVYLPQGIWTRLDTNETYPGRQAIQIKSAGLPVFARNGSIVPLAASALELHYFPKLGAEFFLFENDRGEYSQVHAAPAGDVMRLEIESVRGREYEWVVHHSARPKSVGFEGSELEEAADARLLADGKWFFDAARRNVHVRVRAGAGQDRIVNLSY